MITHQETVNKQAPRDLTPKKVTKKLTKEQIIYQRDKDREMVKGIFRYYEVPGGILEFVLCLYPGDQVEKYSLVDGCVYTIPLGAARHINKNLAYPVHSHLMDENGKHRQVISQRIKRAGFQSLEFMDIEGLNDGGNSSIVMVEATGLI